MQKTCKISEILVETKTKWKHNSKRTDLCKQRRSLCHIGLAKDHGGCLVNQPCKC